MCEYEGTISLKSCSWTDELVDSIFASTSLKSLQIGFCEHSRGEQFAPSDTLLKILNVRCKVLMLDCNPSLGSEWSCTILRRIGKLDASFGPRSICLRNISMENGMEDALLACKARIMILDVSVPFGPDTPEWDNFNSMLTQLHHLQCLFLNTQWTGTKRECWGLCNLLYSLSRLKDFQVYKGAITQPWLVLEISDQEWTMTSHIESKKESRLFKTTFVEVSFLYCVSREPNIPLHILVSGPASKSTNVVFSLLHNHCAGNITARDETQPKLKKRKLKVSRNLL